MLKDSEMNGRLWRRAAGIGAFGVFCCGILLTLGLAQLALLAVALAGCLGLVAAVTWLFVRYREALTRYLVRALRTAVTVAGRIWRVGRSLLVRSGKEGMKATRRLARWSRPRLRTLHAQLRLLAAQTRERTRQLRDRAFPAACRAQRVAVAQLRAARASTSHHVSRAAAVVAADVAAHRERSRAARTRAAEQPPRRRQAQLPAPLPPVGWGEETEDALDTHDEVEPQRGAKDASSTRRGEISASSRG